MDVHHICKNERGFSVRNCVNPVHLGLLTRVDNVLESSVTFSGINAQKTHCKYGHEFTPENTYYFTRPDGRVMRQCKKCVAERNRKRYANGGKEYHRAYRAKKKAEREAEQG